MTTIGQELCPACGRVVWLVRLHTGPAYWHGPDRQSDCLEPGFVRPDEAEAVRRIREREPDLVARAHP
ncbi:hypothetical protein ACH4F6_37560 [Streptomyces sp. NPDC017936]|uniref:hypothetical protein n=1 Tax=Streptomyces sp. NPDC017936 TaxID=3365016 RepID=UPI0037A116F2